MVIWEHEGNVHGLGFFICFKIQILRAQNNKTRFFYVLYSDKTQVFDQSERAQGPIYVIKKDFFTITAVIHARSLVNFYCLYADRHINLKFMRHVSERERAIRQFVIVKNKLMSVFNASVLLLTMNFVITLSKQSADPLGYRLVDPQLL